MCKSVNDIFASEAIFRCKSARKAYHPGQNGWAHRSILNRRRVLISPMPNMITETKVMRICIELFMKLIIT